jgi:Na+-translocating ferredoxin:NAD+ oxidoreductase RnfG subunit
VKRAVVVLVLAWSLVALADRVLLKEADAPRAMFPTSTSSERKTLTLSSAQLEKLGKALGRRIDNPTYPYLDVRDAHGSLGAIFLLDVIGQTQPITFAVGVGEDGTLRDVAVMVYREPHGEEIADKRFRKQFTGKRASDPITLGKDIDAISGATISSRSATFAARKAVELAAFLH